MKNTFKTLISGFLALILATLPVLAAELNNSSTGQWSETDASNTSPSPDGWPSGTYFNQVEPIGRSTMGAIKRFWDRINSQYTVGGTANAITLTPSNTSYPTSYVTGEVYCFKATATNSGATTININGLGAKSIYKQSTSGPAALTGNEIQNTQFVCIAYDGTEEQIISDTPVQSLAGLLTSANNLSDVANAATSRTNLSAAASGANTDITSLSAPALGAATATTAASNTRDTTVATTTFANPAATLSSSGSVTLPSGVIIKWCSGTANANTTTTINYGSTFPNGVYQASVTDTSSAGGTQLVAPVGGIGTSSLQVSNGNGSGHTVSIIVIGH